MVLNDSESFTFFRANNFELMNQNLIQNKVLIGEEIFNLTIEIFTSNKLFEDKLSIKQKLSSISIEASYCNDLNRVEESVLFLTNELICKLLGIPLDDRGLFLIDQYRLYPLESQESYIKSLVEKKLYQPSNDLISSILYAENEYYISHKDIINFLMLLISYGQTIISQHLTNLLRASIDNSLIATLGANNLPLTITRFSKGNTNIDNMSISGGDKLTLWTESISLLKLSRREGEYSGIYLFFEVTLIQLIQKNIQ